MEPTSVWDATLESFCDDLGGTEPAPAAVTASCAVAEMGVSLLLKVLRITGRRKNFNGDKARLNALIEAARGESRELRATADADAAAVRAFIGSRDPAAARQAIEVPMRGARAVKRSADLFASATDLIQGLPAADLGSGAIFLSAAIRAILLSVEFNLRLLKPEESYASSIRLESRALVDHVLQIAAQW